MQQQLELDPDSTRVEIRFQDLLLWRRQAHALGRSWEHLQKIHRLIKSARQEKGEEPEAVVEIPLLDHKVMQRDQREFRQLAFRLMEESRQQ